MLSALVFRVIALHILVVVITMAAITPIIHGMFGSLGSLLLETEPGMGQDSQAAVKTRDARARRRQLALAVAIFVLVLVLGRLGLGVAADAWGFDEGGAESLGETALTTAAMGYWFWWTAEWERHRGRAGAKPGRMNQAAPARGTDVRPFDADPELRQ